MVRRAILLLLGPFAVGAAAQAVGAYASYAPSPAGGRLALALGVAALVTGIAIAIAMLREQPFETGQPADRAAADAPPEGLGAALAAAVRSGDARSIHAIASVFDLAARGHLQFELTDPDHSKSVAAWSIRRLRAEGPTTPWEAATLAAVSAHPGESVPAPAAWRALHRKAGLFREALRDELGARGDIDPRAAERRRPFHVLAVTAALIAVGGFAVAVELLPSVGPASFAPAAGCAVVAAIALAAASAVPRHTRRGRRQALAVRAFERTLRSHARRGTLLDADRFERWFAYAIAFGHASEWLRAAKRSQLAPPAWFGGSRSSSVPLPALEAHLVASGAIESRSSSSTGCAA